MADEHSLLASFHKSKLWSWTRDYLLARRDQLFSSAPTTTTELWKKEGAIQEVNRLLHAPQLVLEYYKQQRKNEDKLDNDYIKNNDDTSESPSSANEGIGLFMRTTDEW